MISAVLAYIEAYNGSMYARENPSIRAKSGANTISCGSWLAKMSEWAIQPLKPLRRLARSMP
jgi:hypothetical protein